MNLKNRLLLLLAPTANCIRRTVTFFRTRPVRPMIEGLGGNVGAGLFPTHFHLFSLLLSAYGKHEASSSFQGPSKFPNVCASFKASDRPPPSLPCRCRYVPTSLCLGARGAIRPVKRCRNVRQRELRRRPHVVRDTGPCCGRCSGEQNPNVT